MTTVHCDFITCPHFKDGLCTKEHIKISRRTEWDCQSDNLFDVAYCETEDLGYDGTEEEK